MRARTRTPDRRTPRRRGRVYIVDAKAPEALRLLAFQQLPTGHTTTCVNGCRALWPGGPAATTTQQANGCGRPIIVTDLSDPRRPRGYWTDGVHSG